MFGVLLLLTHKLREYDALVRSGAWQRGEQFCLLDYPIRELTGRKLGIVGYGTLGRGVARAAQAFGLEVLVANRPGGERVAGTHGPRRAAAAGRRAEPALPTVAGHDGLDRRAATRR